MSLVITNVAVTVNGDWILCDCRVMVWVIWILCVCRVMVWIIWMYVWLQGHGLDHLNLVWLQGYGLDHLNLVWLQGHGLGHLNLVWLQGHGLGHNEGEVVNVPFPICETDDDECKSVFVHRFYQSILSFFSVHTCIILLQSAMCGVCGQRLRTPYNVCTFSHITCSKDLQCHIFVDLSAAEC